MITILNDGKEKQHSWEAELDRGDLVTDVPYIAGYGANEEEAVTDLKNKASNLIRVLEKWDYTKRIRIGHDGAPLEGSEVYTVGEDSK